MNLFQTLKNKFLSICSLVFIYIPSTRVEFSRLLPTLAIRFASFSASYFLAYLIFICLVAKVSPLNFFYFWMAFDVFAGASETITEIICQKLPNLINTENKLSILYTCNLLMFISIFLFIMLIKSF